MNFKNARNLQNGKANAALESMHVGLVLAGDPGEFDVPGRIVGSSQEGPFRRWRCHPHHNILTALPHLDISHPKLCIYIIKTFSG